MKYTYLLIILFFMPFSTFAQDSEQCAGMYSNKIAIFITPTEVEIEKKKKKYGDDFYVIADDQIYYQWNAVEILTKNNFPFCFTKLKEHKFTMPDETEKIIDSKCEGWCLVIWNGKSEPIITSSIDLFIHYEYLGFPPLTKH